jgi:hypothetical protein
MKNPPDSGGRAERVPKILSSNMDRYEGGTSTVALDPHHQQIFARDNHLAVPAGHFYGFDFAGIVKGHDAVSTIKNVLRIKPARSAGGLSR